MPCDWREGALGSGHHSVRRKRRSAGNITAVLKDHLVEDDDEEEEDVGFDRAPKSLGNFSESLNLFQSIQVLANEEEERAFMNETASSESDNLFDVKGEILSSINPSLKSQEFWWTKRISVSRR